MNFRFIAFTFATILFVASVYASSSSIQVFVEARKTVVEISCYPQDNGKTRCCGSEVDDKLVYGYTGVTYCTTCDDTNPPSHCTPREKVERTVVKPGTDVLNALKGSKALELTTPGATTDNTKVPKNLTSKGGELSKEDAKLEDNSNNLPPPDTNTTLQ
ncbi:MAG TPA: hypothetical protein VH481_08935 [Nitrososphaeraceae archaeon]|jgi:hypothetical protein